MSDIFNTRSRLEFTQKHISNIIEEIVMFHSISSIMFQICFWATPSQDLVFEQSEIIKSLITAPKFLFKVLNNFWCLETCPWLWFTQKHIWNIIEEIVFEKSKKVQFLKTISSIMLQICFWASPSRDLVFEISKIMQNFD